MPRAYGKHEIELIVAASFEAGFRRGRVANVYDASDVPHVDDLLREVNVVHNMNVSFDPVRPRSWHKGAKA